MLPIFTYTPSLPYEPEIIEEDVLSVFAGTRNEQRASLLSRPFHRYPLTFNYLRRATRDSMRAFWNARRGRRDPFYWQCLLDYARTGIPLTPSSDGATLSFDLPASGIYSGDHPISDANVKLYRAAVLNGGALSANSDDRKIITNSVPAAGGAAMTADYYYYRKVRFEDNHWNESYISGAGVFRVALALVEVPA